MVDVRPGCEKSIEVFIAGRFNRFVFGFVPDLANKPMIDRAGGAREIRKDILVIGERAPPIDHGFDDRDFPIFQGVPAAALDFLRLFFVGHFTHL